MSTNAYQKQLIQLRGGLDYSSSALEAPPGSLSECLNFETVDYTGYKRIDGFERYDGLTSPSAVFSSAIVQVIQNGMTFDDADAVRPGDFVLNSSGVVIGQVVESSVTSVVDPTVRALIVETYQGALEATGALVVNTYLGAVSLPAPVITLASIALEDSGDGTSVQSLREGYDQVKGLKRKFSQGRVAHGLHRFKGRSYAVVDFESVLVRQVPNTTTGQVAAGVVVPGDYLDSSLFGRRAQVLDVQIVSGSFGAGNTGTVATLEAKILYRRVVGEEGPDPFFATSELLGVRRNGVTTNDVLEVVTSLSEAVEDTWQAGLYNTQIYGEVDPTDLDRYGYWNPVQHPWEFEYKDGQVTTGLPPTELVKKYRLESFNNEDTPSNTDDVAGGVVSAGGVAGDGFYLTSVSDIANDDSAYAHVAANTLGAFGFSCNAIVSGFDLSEIPDDAIITGVEVKVVSKITAAAAAALPAVLTTKPYISGLGLVGGPVTGDNKGGTSVTINSTSEQTNTFGGVYDKWGITDLGTIHTRESTFGVKIAFARAATSLPLANMDVVDVDQIVLKVYYTQPSTKYYFWNGDDDVIADVIKVHTAKGKWDDTSNLPEGTMIVTNVAPAVGATRENISINDEMRTEPGGAGIVVATVSSNMVVCGLASLAQIVNQKSRYQIITANYYGDESWRAMYGCNGAGRAFSYDGTYFQKIFTGAPVDKDKPRHIRSYKSLAGTNGALALGFQSGSVICSVPGEPENYDGALGAIEVSAGSPVVGLANMQGTTLGIFTLDGVYGIKGLSSTSELISLKPKVGAIEYTVQEAGNDVLYCDVYGINSLSQSDLYGDFVGTPLSAKISSWLQPRLRKTTDETQGAVPGIVRASMIVRAKNQYRLFFEGGYALSATLKPEGPEFTIQRYAWVDGEEEFVYHPIALCSEIDEDGRELLLYSHYADYADPSDLINSQDRKRYVFALDRGWSFDGEAIQCHITPYYNFFDGQVFEFKQVNKARLFGLSRGLASLNVYAGKEFESVSSSNPQDISLTFGSVLLPDYTQATEIANIAKRGVCLRLRFEGDTESTEPSYVMQSLLLQHQFSKGDY